MTEEKTGWSAIGACGARPIVTVDMGGLIAQAAAAGMVASVTISLVPAEGEHGRGDPDVSDREPVDECAEPGGGKMAVAVEDDVTKLWPPEAVRLLRMLEDTQLLERVMQKPVNELPDHGELQRMGLDQVRNLNRGLGGELALMAVQISIELESVLDAAGLLHTFRRRST